MNVINSIVHTDCKHNIGRITLNRPDVLNSLTKEMLSDFVLSIQSLEKDPSCRVIVITGAGRGFCAGQDLNDRKSNNNATLTVDLGASIIEFYAPLIEALMACSKPTIAAVNGVAAGAGANIALACDFVVAKASVKFIQAFCKIGLMPDSGGTYFLPRSIGTAKSLGLCLLGEAILAPEAEKLGMIWRAIDDAEFEDYVEGLAKKMCDAPTLALIETRLAIRNSSHSLSAQLKTEALGQRKLGLTNDYQEGVRAFLEKCSPRFSGN